MDTSSQVSSSFVECTRQSMSAIVTIDSTEPSMYGSLARAISANHDAFRKCIAYIGSGVCRRLAIQSVNAGQPKRSALSAQQPRSVAILVARAFHCRRTTNTGIARSRNGLRATATPVHAPAAIQREERADSQAEVTSSATTHEIWPSLSVICTPAAFTTQAAIVQRCVQAPGRPCSTIRKTNQAAAMLTAVQS